MSGARPASPSPVRVDPERQSAWCGERRLDLTPRAFSVLRHLVEHPRRLLTKEDLIAAVWRDVAVSDAALASCIRDIRRELGDSSREPRYVETVHRRGFRFIGPIDAGLPAGPARGDVAAAELRARAPDAAPALVGRAAELAALHGRFDRARRGQRQLVFVTGEPGIGKTALVETFLSEIGAGAARVGRGQCVEQYGAGEAYLPVLEALGRLGREAGGERIVEALRRDAPTWLTQLPSLLGDRELEAVQRRADGATRERMLRELVEALDGLSADEPLVVVLEDLHWSDASTIDLLARLARRREAARLLVVGTYRPAEVAAGAHPLRPVKQELEVHGQCEEMPLEFLSAAAVGEYLARRFPGHRLPPELASLLHRITNGNPLFVVTTVDDLVARARLREDGGTWSLSGPVKDVAAGAPRTLWHMVERQVDRLTPEEHAALAVASVTGVEFSAAIAAADNLDPHDAERRCESLARRGQLLRAAGVAEWPDGTVAGRYAFIHALYQEVLYARIPVARRVGLHLRTGERLERAHGERAGEIAGELAVHFEHGRDLDRAVRYRSRAAENALRQHGHREAAEHATRAIALLGKSPGGPERPHRELDLQISLGTALIALKGYSAPGVERAYARALELCGQVDDATRLVPVLLGLGWFYVVRGPASAARDVGRRLIAVAEATDDRAARLAAENASGVASFYAGELEAARHHLERGLALYDAAEHNPNRSVGFLGGLDPGLSCLCHGAWTFWISGYPDRAAARMREALALARSVDHPFTLAHACRFAAAFHLSRGERESVREYEDATFALSTEHGIRLFLAVGKFHRGWLLAGAGQEEGLALMREWLAVCRDIRAECLIPTYLAWLAEMCGKIGRPREGLDLAGEALAVSAASGYGYWAAEAHRLKGALALRSGLDGAEACFLEAIAVARGQGARLFELRAATDLSRLWADQGRADAAREMLAAVHGRFSEGFDTPDLRAAASLLESLGAPSARRSARG